jgi:hypothetical protein
LEKERLFACRVRAHFARMRRVIPPDAINPPDGENEIGVCHRNSWAGCDGDGVIGTHGLIRPFRERPLLFLLLIDYR